MHYDLTFLAEASGKKKKMSKEDKIVQKDYDQFRAHNLTLAKKLPKGWDLADDQGLTGKGGAVAGAIGGAIGGLPAGPAGMLAGAIGGAGGFSAGTKLARYINHKVYGKYKHKGDSDW